MEEIEQIEKMENFWSWLTGKITPELVRYLGVLCALTGAVGMALTLAKII